MVLDHVLEKQSVELRTARGVQLFHLRICEHAGHEHLVLHAVHLHSHSCSNRVGHGLQAVLEPALHGANLVLLRVDDPRGESLDCGTGPVTGSPASHHDCLRVVPDHRRHEMDVGLRVRMPDAVGSRLRDGVGARWSRWSCDHDGLRRRRGHTDARGEGDRSNQRSGNFL
jgi:hypothetical protein